MNNKPPYYAVIFTSSRTEGDHGYSEMAQRMEDLAKRQPGYIDFETARGEVNLSVSYWESLEAIANWKANADHLLAQQKGIDLWYKQYKIRICLVEREYEFEK